MKTISVVFLCMACTAFGSILDHRTSIESCYLTCYNTTGLEYYAVTVINRFRNEVKGRDPLIQSAELVKTSLLHFHDLSTGFMDLTCDNPIYQWIDPSAGEPCCAEREGWEECIYSKPEAFTGKRHTNVKVFIGTGPADTKPRVEELLQNAFESENTYLRDIVYASNIKYIGAEVRTHGLMSGVIVYAANVIEDVVECQFGDRTTTTTIATSYRT